MLEIKTLDNLFGTTEGLIGPMGGGKTNEFIRRCKRLVNFADSKRYVVRIVKSPIDDRIVQVLREVFEGDPTKTIQSRDGLIISKGVYSIKDSYELFHLLDEARIEAEERFGLSRVVIAISETQFLDSGVVDFVDSLDNNTYLLWEGLDKSFRGEPFLFSDYKATIFDLMDLSDELFNLPAICEHPDCTRRNVNYTQRINEEELPSHYGEELIVVGELQYQARCREHHIVPGRRKANILRSTVRIKGNQGIKFNELFDLGEMVGIPVDETKQLLDCFIREKQFQLKDNYLIYTGTKNHF
ncbi:MAG: Thymidine kinase [Candidatus Woesearchaeota archaeon]|nr:Thymidine kinase [Candidatus Woesearchaeota archaeon]